ncbi:hypothetical protein AC230_19200 [Streptomyces caatingaensis]|uniref:FAD dependent oxidoreductase domain-containing protein n=1 Tax=Streptomyces caatingaensis TaxID=1678637 RepID=A0A0K9XE39_9ACTN|nr:hypothetical protein AC230_19200 [Streptomyces caatingaensis]
MVGAGVFGLSVARELALRSWSVRVVDPRPPGTRGPSAGETRILRCAHGTDPWYAELARRATAQWRALERESGRRLLLPTGVLTLGPAADDGWERAAHGHLTRLGVPAELLTAGAAARRFPGFAPGPGSPGGTALFEPEAGVLLAREATAALAASATAHRAELIRAEATARDGGTAVVGGEPWPADLTVWAVGTALPALFPGLTTVRPVRQDCWYVRPGGPWAADGRQPAWLDRAHGCYGIPAVASHGVKVVPDVETPPGAPADPRPGEAPPALRAYLRARLPALAGAPVTHREVCSYALAADEHFVLARHPGRPGVWLVGGDSGHGFKHGPAWGAFVCDVVEGRRAAPPRFALR